MKKAVLISLCLGATLANAQPWLKNNKSDLASTTSPTNVLFRQEAIEYKPAKSVEYYWNGTEYTARANVAYTYDSQGRLIKEVKRLILDNSISSLKNFGYDSFGNQILSENFSYYNNELSYGYRTTRQYEGDQETLYLYESYSSSAKKWKTNSGYKNVLVKDSKGNVIKETRQDADTNGVFTNASLSEYTFNAKNEITLVLNSNWNGTAWENDEKFLDIVWFDVKASLLTSYKYQKWDGAKFQNVGISSGSKIGDNWVSVEDTLINNVPTSISRYTRGLTPIVATSGIEYNYSKSEKYLNNKWVTTDEYVPSLMVGGGIKTISKYSEYDKNGNFLEGNIYTNEYDSKGSLTFYSSSSVDVSGAETHEYSTRTVFVYDINGNRLSEESEYRSKTTPTFSKSGKIVYSDFLPFELTGFNDANLKNALVNVFPNPSIGVFQLNATAQSVLVTDMSGSIVLEQTSPSTQINLSNQAKGIYFAQIKIGDDLVTQKLVVE